jgi:hypothetical protein
MKRAAGLVFVLAMAAARPAGAELRELAGRVADAYRASGARVVVLPTRFLYDDETLVVTPPPARGERCVTMAIVGARGLSFHVGEGEDEGGHVYSVAGALALESCDGQAGPVRVKSDAGRGALEVVVGYGAKPLPTLRSVLPERMGGVMPAIVDPGPVPALPTPQKRAEAAESVARRDGAVVAPRAMATANADGAGVVRVRLERGCHRLELFSPESRAGRHKLRLDLDAELHDAQGDALLARDRGEAADARLDVCAGEDEDALLSFGGALPLAPVIIALASWPMPESVPRVWGPDASRRLAGALRSRHVTPKRPAVALYEGVVGATSFVARVEPGACYVAVAAATRGEPRGLVLRALVGAAEHADERGTADGAALVSFCTGDGERVRLTVEARGTAMAWGAALYRMTSGAWEREP